MIGKIKEYFDIKNLSVANYLGISYNTMKSISANRRTYNFKEMNRLLILHTALSLEKKLEKLPTVVNFMILEKKEAENSLEKLLASKKNQLRKEEASLEALKTKREVWLRGLNACSELLKREGQISNDIKWLNLRKEHLILKLSEHSYVSEVALVVEVQALEMQVAAIDSLM